MKSNRRLFLKNISLAAGTGLLAKPLTYSASDTIKDEEPNIDKLQTVHILQTTDIHCQIHSHDELFWENNNKVFRKTGGYARLKTFIHRFKKQNPNCFLLDSGDMFQGSELSVLTKGEAIVPILNAMEYDLYLPGNWEVIYKKKSMQHLLGSLTSPKVCANMYHDLGDGKKGELVFPAYHIWAVNGIKIGFLGYTDHMVPQRQSPNYSKGVIYTNPEENLAHYVDVLRNYEKCNAVIMVAHLGLSQQIHLANQSVCAGVDYILGGDTHERVRKPIVGKYSKVVEPGAFGSFVGQLELTFKGGKLVKDDYKLIEINANHIKPDRKMQELIARIEFPYREQIDSVIGYSNIPLYRYFVIENPIDTMILDAMRWQMPEVDVVLSNGFRFCPPRTTPDHTGMIPITSGYIFDMLPVDSIIRIGKVTGKQLQEWMEKELNNVFAKEASERFGGWVVKFDGMKVEFNAFGEKGKRVKSITIRNMPIKMDSNYTISACERDGDPIDMICRIRNVQDVHNTQYTLHSVMKTYLRANSPVSPTPKRNAISLDAPETLLTQVTGVDYQFT